MGCVASSGAMDETQVTPRSTELDVDRPTLAHGTPLVAKRQLDWVAREKTELGADANKLQEHFLQLVEQFGEAHDEDAVPDQASRQVLLRMFDSLGIRADAELFDTIFKLMDANNTGFVSKDEFVVAFAYLSYEGSARDHVETAFRLFDSNRDGLLSRNGFNRLVSALIGQSLVNLFKIDGGRKVLESIMRRELCMELLEFIDATGHLESRNGGPADARIPAKKARDIYDEFIAAGSPKQINVSAAVRNACKDAVSPSVGDDGRRPSVNATFHRAAAEAVALIEQGPLNRVKEALRERNYAYFANPAWAGLGLDPKGPGMDLDEFRSWATRQPEFFSVFDEIAATLASASKRMVKAQRSA